MTGVEQNWLRLPKIDRRYLIYLKKPKLNKIDRSSPAEIDHIRSPKMTVLSLTKSTEIDKNWPKNWLVRSNQPKACHWSQPKSINLNIHSTCTIWIKTAKKLKLTFCPKLGLQEQNLPKTVFKKYLKTLRDVKLKITNGLESI